MEVYLSFCIQLFHGVHNFEPGGMKKYFDNRWEVLSDPLIQILNLT